MCVLSFEADEATSRLLPSLTLVTIEAWRRKSRLKVPLRGKEESDFTSSAKRAWEWSEWSEWSEVYPAAASAQRID